MKDVITVATMRESDAHTIALYVPSRELMYRAAMGVYQAVNWQGKKVAIFTGSGNNGGDGYALAGILADHSVPCCLYKSRSTILRMENIIMTRLWKKGWSGSDFLRGRIYPATTSWWTASWEPDFLGPCGGRFNRPFRPSIGPKPMW